MVGTDCNGRKNKEAAVIVCGGDGRKNKDAAVIVCGGDSLKGQDEQGCSCYSVWWGQFERAGRTKRIHLF